jgi:very-short-patch-repair endonuclease
MKLNNKLLHNSKLLRKQQTPWESRLWYFLRGKRFLNYKFKRQYIIGEFIVDFCCFKEKLIIELDGSQHNDLLLQKDTIRDSALRKLGYKKLRFWNNEIDENIEGVLEKILNHLSPILSPGRREEKNI